MVCAKYFFRYTNKHKQAPSSPCILVDDNNNTVTEPKEIADLLQDQFRGVFSDPITSNSYQKYFTDDLSIKYPLSDLVITDKDIIAAIDEMKSSSSCPKQDIPAKVLKECKHSLSTPLKLFWNKSFIHGKIP